MKLTERDLEIFRALSETGLGKDIVDYCERLIDHVCNSRHWGPNDTKESTQQTAKIIEELLINKIRLQNKPKQVNPNQYE